MSDTMHWREFRVHGSASPDQDRLDLEAGLKVGRLPARLHYLTPRQVRAWIRLHEAYSPAVLRSEVQSLSRVAFEAWHRSRQNFGEPWTLVSLGCGGAHKEAGFGPDWSGLEAVVPVDAGVPMLWKAMDRLESVLPVSVPCLPLAMDLMAQGRGTSFLKELSGVSEAPRLVTCFGVIPNLAAVPFLQRLATWLRPGVDELLFGANLVPGTDATKGASGVLREYDNPETRAWLGLLLEDLCQESFDVDRILFAVAEPALTHGPARIVASVRWEQDQVLMAEGNQWTWPAGSPLEIFQSNRFTTHGLESLLERLGFRIRGRWLDPEGVEAVYRVQLPEA